MEKYFLYGSATVYYKVTGSGEPVVLLHGFGEDSTIWNSQVNFLKEHFKLIVPDLPGSGKSQRLNEKCSIDSYAECVRALLETEQVDECVMLGHSMGGYITLAFAELFSKKLRAFGLVHSTAFADTEEKKNSRLKSIQLIKEYSSYSFLKNTTPNLFSEDFKKEHQGELSEFLELGKDFDEDSLVQYYYAMIGRPDRTRLLADTDIPVLFVIGSEDVAAPLQDLLQQVHLPKVAYIHIIEGAGHMSMIEKPGELNQYLLDFLCNAL